MHHSRQGLLSVHAAVLIFSFTALFSKLVSLPALEITFYRLCAGRLCSHICCHHPRCVADLECHHQWPYRDVCGEVRVVAEEEKLTVSAVYRRVLMLLFSEFLASTQSDEGEKYAGSCYITITGRCITGFDIDSSG
jgi:hypothetical protein